MYIVNTTCHKMLILRILVAFYFVLYMHMYVEMIPVFRSIYIVFFPECTDWCSFQNTVIITKLDVDKFFTKLLIEKS